MDSDEDEEDPPVGKEVKRQQEGFIDEQKEETIKAPKEGEAMRKLLQNLRKGLKKK